MAKVELLMPKMGESIMEATILKWVKKVGDKVEEDETILEIATDKVDSEIPSPVDGVITEIYFKEEDVVDVGKVIAIIATEGDEKQSNGHTPEAEEKTPASAPIKIEKVETPKSTPAVAASVAPPSAPSPTPVQGSTRFYSPLVKSIAKKENIATAELDRISGSGANGRVTKHDIMNYVATRQANGHTSVAQPQVSPVNKIASSQKASTPTFTSTGGADEIVQMGRMRKLIADHMVMSKRTSPHVTSFVEADVTNMVNWRNAIKGKFLEQHGEKITYTPLILDAVIKALKDFR